MATRYLLAGTAALAFATAAAGQTVKPQAPANEQRPAQVVLASAEQAQATVPTADAVVSKPVKRPRAARVTSCRCAGQVSPPEQANQ